LTVFFVTRFAVFFAVLTITDNHTDSTTAAPIQIDVGILPPVVTITSPAANFTFQIGTTIPIKVKAIDAQDGRLGNKSVSTEIDYWTGGHVYPVTGFIGAKGSVLAAAQGFEDAFYRITTTATDSYGLSTVVTKDVQPQTILVTVKSAPEGVTVSVDGLAQVTPYTFPTIVGSARELDAPDTASVSGTSYTFQSWTIGSAPPANSAFSSYTAPATALKIVAKYRAT
jgi:hypothetical protein